MRHLLADPKSRTVLVRENERHTVTVVVNGFVWREATYASVSTIARAITGWPIADPGAILGAVGSECRLIPSPLRI